MSELLRLEEVTKLFGGLAANQDVSFTVDAGEVIGLIGPNGAGKSTLFNCISCFYKATKGRILLHGKDITRLTPEAACGHGIGRTFQIVRVFREMSVLENVTIGAFLKHGKTRDALRQAEEVAGLFGFSDRLHRQAGSLTISEQKRLEMARAFATAPKILLLDEVMAGLNIQEVRETSDLIGRLKRLGMALILVEHVMEGIMPIADKVVVLDYGRKIAEGPPQEIVRDEKVIKAYLGEKYAKRRANTPLV
jgi:branched-chain amino acid transport system ATP-binding protein